MEGYLKDLTLCTGVVSMMNVLGNCCKLLIPLRMLAFGDNRLYALHRKETWEILHEPTCKTTKETKPRNKILEIFWL